MYKTQRWFAKRSLRFTVLYNLYLFACTDAMKSRSMNSLLVRVLKTTTLPSIHLTARRRVGVQSVHFVRKSHSIGIYVRIVLRISASFCIVHCHICSPSPHSMRRCWIVSCMPQLLRLLVGDIRILWRRTFVSRTSCITFYHTAFVPPGTAMQWMFFHTVFRSVVVHILVMRISCIIFSPLLMWYKVLYTFLL